MYFSEKFEVDRNSVLKYGAIDISLVCDIPLFVDPMLIFNSKKKDYRRLHNEIIEYFAFLTEKSKNVTSTAELNTYFNFHEVKNNWLGYSIKGNEGNGLGFKFAKFLGDNLQFIMEDSEITESKHIEKSLLLYDGNGKDKISDLTTKLILGYLAEYTQNYATKNIKEKYLQTFYLDSEFDYETESYRSIRYKLPFIINRKGEKEFVLLTPDDIVREEEPAISKSNYQKNWELVRAGISNQTHRLQLGNYLSRAVKEYIKNNKDKFKKGKTISEMQRKKIEKDAFFEATKEKEFKWLYDYFISITEKNSNNITEKAKEETKEQVNKFYVAAQGLRTLFEINDNNQTIKASTAKEELLYRLNYMKHIIEDCDGYKNLNHNNSKIASEDDLNRLFRFTLAGTKYDYNFDANNGRGEFDIKASFGANDKCLAELKLASNPKLSNIFNQTKIYEKANDSSNSVYAIFIFDITDQMKINKLFIGNKQFKENKNDIVLIDCRKDNKKSGSTI